MNQDLNVLIAQAFYLNSCKDKLFEDIEYLQKSIAALAIDENNRLAAIDNVNYRLVEDNNSAYIAQKLTQFNSFKNIITEEA